MIKFVGVLISQPGAQPKLILWSIVSLLAGGVTTLAFSPFDHYWLVFITLAVVFSLWNKLPARQAAFNAWLFGLGLQCSGVSWIYYSLHVHGSAPAIFAIILVFLLCCYLALYTALSVYTVNRFLPDNSKLRFLLFYPASWVLFEWLQGYVMTGFAWMQLGYTQIDTPLSAWAPLLGNHAVGGVIAVSAGSLAMIIFMINNHRSRSRVEQAFIRRGLIYILPVAMIWLLANLLQGNDWTDKDGEPIKVSVIQANIPQQEKWKRAMKQPTKDLYRKLSLEQQDVDLIVWPETAVPDYLHRITPYIQQLSLDMRARNTDLILGVFIQDSDGGLLNSVINVHGGIYHKRHLVPLGEYIPLRFMIEFFNKFVKIPMSDIASGDDSQKLLTAAGIPIAVSICFEEAFARDVIRDLPEAKMLVNVSNDAWFEDSHEPHQHHVIARMRALETGRYMIRSTNTGITSLIDPQGKVIKRLPQFETAVLSGEVFSMSGATPFVRWGDTLIVGLCCLLLLGFAIKNRKVIADQKGSM